ncbi:hypothetical protein AaE_008359, partial [Aphanomyces astaci]
APNEASSTVQSRQGLKKVRNGPKKDVAALMTEVRNLQRQIKTMSQSAVIPSGDSSEEDTYAMALDDDHHSLDKHGPRITMEVQTRDPQRHLSKPPWYHTTMSSPRSIQKSMGRLAQPSDEGWAYHYDYRILLPDGRFHKCAKSLPAWFSPSSWVSILNFKDRTITWDGAVKPMSDDTHCMAHDRTIKDADYAMPTFEEMIPAHLGKEEKLQLLQVLNDHADAFTGKLGNFDLEPFEIPIQHGTKPYATRPYPIPTNGSGGISTRWQISMGIPNLHHPKKRRNSEIGLRLSTAKSSNYSTPLPPAKDPRSSTVLNAPGGEVGNRPHHGILRTGVESLQPIVTAIVLPFGKYVYLPMGNVCAPDEFQYAMNLVVGDLSFVKCYLDDLLVVSSSFAEHLDHLRIVFQRLIKFGIVAHAWKSKFCAETIDYLGFVLTKDGVCPQSNKVEAIVKILPPKTRKELRRFIGMVNYYRDLWPKRAHLCAPWTKLTSDKVAFKWTPDAQLAFDAVKNMVAQSTMLAYPDFALPFDIHTDASKYQLGAVISQHGAPLAFW